MTVTTTTRATLSATLPALLLALLLAAGARPAAAQQPQPAGRKINERHAMSPTAAIRVYGSFASVRVIGWDKDSIAVTGTVAAGEQFFGGGGMSGRKYGLEVAGASGGGGGGGGSTESRSSRVEFYVPARARVWVKTATADIEVSGVTGGLDLNIVGGSIRVTGAPSELSAEAMDGDIEVTGAVPWLRAKTAGGAIRATVRGGSDVGLSSVSGRLTLVEAKAGAGFQRVRLETVTGDIAFEGGVGRGGRLDADSHSGAVDLLLPGDQAADFVLTNITGTIRSDFRNTPTRSAAEMRGRELVFTTGSGGADISVRNFKGAVAVRKKG